MVEETPREHRKWTPEERKRHIQARIDELANWVAELRTRAETGVITWGKFDYLMARAMVARERYGVWKRKHSLVDTLTGIPNKRWFKFELNREIKEAKRLNKPLGVLMLDIDHFKEINDKYGHPEGDRVLRTVAQAIEVDTRAEDFFARYGGEEFAVVVIRPKENTLKEIAERFKNTVENIKIEGLPKITISVGGTIYKQDEDLESFINRADKALYNSKEEGRNRVTIG